MGADALQVTAMISVFSTDLGILLLTILQELSRKTFPSFVPSTRRTLDMRPSKILCLLKVGNPQLLAGRQFLGSVPSLLTGEAP